MKTYLGTKLVSATPMTRQAYNDYRGWELPADEEGSDEGYLVEYVNSSPSNHPLHAGYISWSPRDIFEEAYREVSGLTFSEALEGLKAGECVRRAGWNGKNMYVKLRDADAYSDMSMPFLWIRTYDGEKVPWVASQTDILAEDWELVN